MSKYVISILLLVAMLFAITYAGAEDLSKMSTEELIQLRQDINNELASRNTPTEVPEGAAIADLFPDHILAMKVRDAVGAISTKDPITQEELDTIKTISINGAVSGETHEFKDLTGIDYLRNVVELHIVRQPDFVEMPESIEKCIHLKVLDLRSCGLKTLPAAICNLTALEELKVSSSELESLPDDIGNLESLKKLDISYTKVTELPVSIRNLSLEKFNREGLDLD